MKGEFGNARWFDYVVYPQKEGSVSEYLLNLTGLKAARRAHDASILTAQNGYVDKAVKDAFDSRVGAGKADEYIAQLKKIYQSEGLLI